MATRREPRFKLCRRLGVNVYGHPKAMKRMETDSKSRSKKQSEYGMRLLEKQKLKAYYGIFEKHLLRYYKKASKSGTDTGTVLLTLLECRLDNIVYRIGFANSIRLARQQVNHGHILVNDKKVDIPSYHIKPGDRITLKEKSRKIPLYLENFEERAQFNYPYIEKDIEKFSAEMTRLPQRDEIPVEITDRLIVEYFARK